MADISEQRARKKGKKKGWSEEKIQRRAKLRRGARKVGLLGADIAAGAVLPEPIRSIADAAIEAAKAKK